MIGNAIGHIDGYHAISDEAAEKRDEALDAHAAELASDLIDEVASSDLSATIEIAGRTIRFGQPCDAILEELTQDDINGEQPESQLRLAIQQAAMAAVTASTATTSAWHIAAAGRALMNAVKAAAARAADAQVNA